MTRKRILIVEDIHLLARDMKCLLEDEGYEVSGIALSAEDALDEIEKSRPDLVLMDIKLHGGLDGIAASAAVRERFSLPVIFVTGNVDKATIARMWETGPAGIIRKPFEEQELFDMLAGVFFRGAGGE